MLITASLIKHGDQKMATTRINLDAVFRDAQLGSINKSISQTLGGLRTGHRRIITPNDRVNHGYVFLTRPQLNLSEFNVLKHRQFFPLLNNFPDSLGAWIRGVLDPRWVRYGNRSEYALVNKERMNMPIEIQSTQVDTDSPFINAVSNNIVNVSGFPDIDVPIYTSEHNRIGAVYQQVDGVENLNMPVDITMTIRDVIGSPIFHLFRILSLYAPQIYQGVMNRYEDMILEDCMDYNVRLYRILIAPDGETVHSIASTFPGIIPSVTAGARYDYNMDEPYDTNSNMISIRMVAPGVIYEDPALVDDFNLTVGSTNMKMRDRTTYMKKIPRDRLEYFSYERVYPWIDILTYKLEWWIDPDTYNRVNSQYQQYVTKQNPNTI